ncbi:hypothetical protein EN935_35565, partial [Mesorhizobium sp. M7D.F.Ca.US.004.03.1.1]|uniref:ABC transporter substrate-binding protein n=1 Tax=Mesorhizobium sp. M7D.F.Ca.US.004.03.1.1 TaxID=2496702 RepID=UPI000FD28EE9
TSTIQVVGSGSQTIGLASLSAVATAVSKGVPVIGIAGIMQRAPESIISLQKKGPINSPKDVEGKTMGAEPGDQAQRLFDAFAAKTNIDLSTIKKVNVTKTGALQALLNEDVDFVAAWAVPDGTKANKIKAINKPLMFADYGVNTLSTGIFVTTETAEKKADTLKKFMAATIKAADDVAKDPQAGIDAVKKASADVDPEILKIEIKDLPNMLHTDHSKGKPFGWVAQEDLLQTIDILETYFGMAKGLTPDKIYTDRFFPPQN